MNIIFLTMNSFKSIDMHNIYSDLMKVFIAHGDRPYIVTPREKQTNEMTELVEYSDYSILKVRIGNTSNVSFFEKGITTVMLESHFKKAIKKYLCDIHFDIILYSTPPITLVGVVKYLKKKYNARTYLMLKDIFPQNAIDLGLFSSGSPIAKYFRWKERLFYNISDKIGCMSQANVDFVLKHNLDIPNEKVEILPNAIIPNPLIDREKTKKRVREKFDVPNGAITLLFGGNLGKPQGIPFLIDCLKAAQKLDDFFFIICGQGSEYHLIDEFVRHEQPANVRLVDFLPKKEYDQLASGCDVGLIFLDYRFSIPNFPSRVLTYMEYATPVICATDPNTDIGKMVVDNRFGFSCLSNDTDGFLRCLEKLRTSDLNAMGTIARDFCKSMFSVEECYKKIVELTKDDKKDRVK